MANHPKLSAYLITFNQAQFLSQALDSILMQRVSFEYEIVIGDDGSTDGSADLIKSYQRRWPEKIKPVLQEKNVGMMRNAVDTLENCHGEYVACLEGDDYWTDPDKVQCQVDYLDT